MMNYRLSFLLSLALVVGFTSFFGCTPDDEDFMDPTIECDSLFSASIVVGVDSLLMVDAFGGEEPYTYEWASGETTSSLEWYGYGTYSVTVTDANDCTAVVTFGITDPNTGGVDSCALFASIYADSSGTGLLLTSVINGTPPYSYDWSDGSTNATLDNVVDGTTYTVTVTDAMGCAFMTNYEYNDWEQDPCLSLMTTLNAYQDSLEVNMTTLVATTAGGTQPYVYIWSHGATESHIVVANDSGLYTVTVTDENGCENVADIEL